jgi:PAS domain S-box-containing protein
MIGNPISAIIPDALQDEEKAILSNIKAGRSIDHYQTRRCRKDGKLIYVSLTLSPLRDAAGKIIGASKILRDISEQKLIEEIIRQSEANYRQLFTMSPAPMWLIDQETKQFIQVNKAAVMHYGYTEPEFAAMTLDDILQSKDFSTGTQHVKKTGEIIDVETSSIPVMINGKKQVMMIAVDISEKSRYEQKLTRAAIKAQEEERYEIGGELHDNVCQILATSMIFLGMIKEAIPDESKNFYNHAHEYINLATTEIRNLSHRLAPAFFDKATLEDAFHQLLENINVANQYDIRLHFNDCAKNCPIAREQQLNLYRILQEQVRNISKYAKASLIEVEVMVVNNHLRMSIADNGIGFDLSKTSGGIGFANMNRRIQLYNGKLRIEAAPGKGCTVIAEMPVQR